MSHTLPKLLAGLLLATFVPSANALVSSLGSQSQTVYAFVPSVNSAFGSRLGGQAFYDGALNVTWLADANLAASNTFGVSGIGADGSMSWATAQSWIGAMNTANYLGYSDWRLPTTGPVNGTAMNEAFSYNGTTDSGFNVSAPGTAFSGSQGSEMAYLFFNELGNLSACDPVTSTASSCTPQAGYGLTHSAPFSNVQAGPYWSGSRGQLNSPWLFDFYNGLQTTNMGSDGMYAWGVRSGDSALLAPVPEPKMWGMMLAGLALVGASAKRRLSKV